MGWSEIVRLIVTFGIDQAFKIWEITHRFPDGPTAEAWDALKAANLKTYDDYIRESQERKNLGSDAPIQPS